MPPKHKEILELLKVEWFIDHGGHTRTEKAEVSEVSLGGGGFSSTEVEHLVQRGEGTPRNSQRTLAVTFRS